MHPAPFVIGGILLALFVLALIYAAIIGFCRASAAGDRDELEADKERVRQARAQERAVRAALGPERTLIVLPARREQRHG